MLGSCTITTVYIIQAKLPSGRVDDPNFLSYIEKLTGSSKAKPNAAVKPDINYEEVCADYKNTNSIKKTSKNVGLSEEKVKKILITSGLYTSPKQQEITALAEQGKTIDEIAEQLKMSPKQIRVFLPYTKWKKGKLYE